MSLEYINNPEEKTEYFLRKQQKAEEKLNAKLSKQRYFLGNLDAIVTGI